MLSVSSRARSTPRRSISPVTSVRRVVSSLALGFQPLLGDALGSAAFFALGQFHAQSGMLLGERRPRKVCTCFELRACHLPSSFSRAWRAVSFSGNRGD